VKRRIACIVEGHGEVDSLPLLLRRIHEQSVSLRFPELQRNDVLRIPRSKLLREGELERAVMLAASKVGPAGAVLVLLYSDDDAPCELGPTLLARAMSTGTLASVAVVLAHREYEAWFLTSASSLAGRCGLSPQLEPPPDPESIRDAKGWLREQMAGRSYREVVHQPRLTAVMDLDQARRARSFEKLWREVTRILGA
jgi:hypothetical protein